MIGQPTYEYGQDIHADSVPILDSWFWEFDKPDKYWNCFEWMLWHEKRKEKYGQKEANDTFVIEWLKQDSFANPYSWCKYQSDFTDYFDKQGLDMGWALSKTITKGGELVEGAAEGAARSGKLLKYALPIVLIGAAIYFAYPYIKAAKFLK